MELGSPFDALHSAIASALHRDLDNIKYQTRDWEAYKGPGHPDIRITKERRPTSYDIEVLMFAQSWGSGALGYGGMGTAAVTPAYTVVVFNWNEYCVYFGSGGVLAYKIKVNELTPEGREQFTKDLQQWNLPSRRELAKRYGLPENDQSSDI